MARKYTRRKLFGAILAGVPKAAAASYVVVNAAERLSYSGWFYRRFPFLDGLISKFLSALGR